MLGRNCEVKVVQRDIKDLKADFILANPPFNISDWGGERLKDDVRWKYGVPPVGNANYGWIQHMIHHLAPTGPLQDPTPPQEISTCSEKFAEP